MNQEDKQKLVMYYNKLNQLLALILKTYKIPYLMEEQEVNFIINPMNLVRHTIYKVNSVKCLQHLIINSIRENDYVNQHLSCNMSLVSSEIIYQINMIAHNNFQCFENYNYHDEDIIHLLHKDILEPNIRYYNNMFENLIDLKS